MIGLRSLIMRLKARLFPRAVLPPAPPVPSLQLWELWEGAPDEDLREVLDGIREDMAEDVEAMQAAYRSPN